MANHGQITVARPAPMDIAVATAHGAEGRTKIGTYGVQDGVTESQATRGIPDQGRKNVSFMKGDAEGGAEGLLTAAQKDAAVDFSGAVQRCKLVIQKSCAQHETIGGEVRFSNDVRRAGFERGSQHDPQFIGGFASQQCFFQARKAKKRGIWEQDVLVES